MEKLKNVNWSAVNYHSDWIVLCGEGADIMSLKNVICLTDEDMLIANLMALAPRLYNELIDMMSCGLSKKASDKVDFALKKARGEINDGFCKEDWRVIEEYDGFMILLGDETVVSSEKEIIYMGDDEFNANLLSAAPDLFKAFVYCLIEKGEYEEYKRSLDFKSPMFLINQIFNNKNIYLSEKDKKCLHLLKNKK